MVILFYLRFSEESATYKTLTINKNTEPSETIVIQSASEESATNKILTINKTQNR